MTDNSSDIDLSLTNIWHSWRAFRAGKKRSHAIILFESKLEMNLLRLCTDLNSGRYMHGEYAHKIVNEKKRRDIQVANVRDRVVHRLLYDYLVPIVDRRLDYDVWSCRPGKGVHQAVERARHMIRRHPQAWVWRADVTKFFDNVTHTKLMQILKYHVVDHTALELLERVVTSYAGVTDRGIPIGNLTSQIFANIYLNEFDRLVRHTLKPLSYIRYGDDFLVFAESEQEAIGFQCHAAQWLRRELFLSLHKKNNHVIKRPKAPISSVIGST